MVKNNLARLLSERKWTQADLARKTGIRPNTINAYYNEFIERVSLDQIVKICDVLECRLSDFMEYKPKNPLSSEKYYHFPGSQVMVNCPFQDTKDLASIIIYAYPRKSSSTRRRIRMQRGGAWCGYIYRHL